MNCDRIARFYQWLEYGAFGRTLERRRCEFLDLMGDAQTALVIGDGDGRFLAELHKRYPEMDVDSIELSAQMVSVARRRTSSPHIRFFQADARSVTFPRDRYDLIVTHFFLDCLTEAESSDLIARLSSVAGPASQWIVSEFRMPPGGWPALHASLWLRTMYFFFGMTTGLSVRRLPGYHGSLTANGFTLDREVTERFGLVASESWVGRQR